MERIIDLRARALILENVAAMASMGGGIFLQRMVVKLESAGYCVHHRILDTQDHGLPQRRRRIYVVGFLTTRSATAFTWTSVIRHVGLEDVLEPRGSDADGSGGLRLSGFCAQNVNTALARVNEERLHDHDVEFIIDAD